tara:strand:+ start:233 stop:418 length:186 start_codon:yes stop_codon:yes gene_type:complete
MGLKKYVLTIQFDDNGDNCEYIEEKILDETSENERIIYEADLKNYFSASDLACLLDDLAEA